MNILKSILVATISLSLAACDSDNDGNGSTANNADLQGKWASTCQPDGDGNSERDEFTANGNSFTQSVVTYYRAEDCTGDLTLGLDATATFTIDGTTSEVAEGVAKNIDIFFERVAVSASSQYSQLLAQQGTTLEALYAAAGVPDINNIQLSDIGLPSTFYTIYQVDGNVLRVGDDSGGFDATSPALRHVRLESSNPYIRQ